MATTTTPAKPTTTATDKILGAWTNHIVDGVGTDTALTTKRIMDLTGLSRSTVNATLNKLAGNGDVIRYDADKVSTWSLTPTRKAALKRAANKAAKAAAKTGKPKATTKPVKANRPATRTTTKGFTVTEATNSEARTDTGRRRKGAIDFEIRAYFEGTDNAPAGSYAVAKAVGSSSGAAYVALRRMANEGKATLVSSDPDRYVIEFNNEAWNVTESE